MKLLSTVWFRRLQSSSALPFTCVRKIATRDHGRVMNRLLIVAILIIYAVPLHVQAQHADLAKLKADAQRIVRVIGGDRAKTQAYCQIQSLGDEMDRAEQMMDEQKGDALTKKINDLEKQIGPEYLALFNALNNVDQNSKDFQDILSLFHALDKSCPH